MPTLETYNIHETENAAELVAAWAVDLAKRRKEERQRDTATIAALVEAVEEMHNWICANVDASDPKFPTFVLDRADNALALALAKGE
jgi:hypothetical protein